MAISKTDLRYYLTSVEPFAEQTVYSQSIGGYAAFDIDDLEQSLVYKSSVLSGLSGFYSGSLSFDDATNISESEYLQSNSEILKVGGVAGNVITISERGINNLFKVHPDNTEFFGLNKTDGVFDNTFSKDFTQYRCFAMRNNGTGTAYSVKFYIKQPSRNTGCAIRLAIEIPEGEYLSSSTTSVSENKITVIDASLVSVKPDGYYKNAVLRFTSGANDGQEKIISSFTSSTGTFVLQESLTNTPQFGDSYEIDPTPSQRTKSSINIPAYATDYVSDFKKPNSSNPLDINVNGNRGNGSDLEPGEIVYLWIERKLDKNSVEFEDNSIVITMVYSAEVA